MKLSSDFDIANAICPKCGCSTFQRDTKTTTEFLELGADQEWVVTDTQDVEYSDPRFYVYCSSCFTGVKLTKTGRIDILTKAEIEEHDDNEDNL